MWTKSESNERPLEAEQVTNGRYILRRNIQAVEDSEGNTRYTYEERIITDLEYGVLDAVKAINVKREAEIIDEFVLQLIEEGDL